MSKVPFCHRVQTSPGISSEKPFWIQTIQVPEMQLQLCQQGKKYFFGNLAKSLRVAVIVTSFFRSITNSASYYQKVVSRSFVYEQ